RQALDRLSEAGLIERRRDPGSKTLVKLTQLAYEPPEGQPRRYIYKQIPWAWVCKAAKCPTPGLLVGLAVWKASCKPASESLVKIDLNQLEVPQRPTRSLLRGLKAIEAAGLVELSGRKASVAQVRILSVGRLGS
ncbi:MAG: hypothetical protein ACKO85_18250, partial [Isosphaeraceae bacterium]